MNKKTETATGWA